PECSLQLVAEVNIDCTISWSFSVSDVTHQGFCTLHAHGHVGLQHRYRAVKQIVDILSHSQILLDPFGYSVLCNFRATFFLQHFNWLLPRFVPWHRFPDAAVKTLTPRPHTILLSLTAPHRGIH